MDTTVSGTLTLLEEAVAAGVGSFVFTSTTSAFGRALTPLPGEPAAWITEDVAPRPRNIYGVTKTAAEDLCELVHAEHGLPVIVLRTSRFFPEGDDDDRVRAAYADANVKANEYLYRRVDVADVADAHLLAMERAAADRVRPVHRQRDDAVHPGRPGRAARRRARGGRRGCSPTTRRSTPAGAGGCSRPIGRVYVNARARADLGWTPRYDFRSVLDALKAGEDPSQPARAGHRRQGVPRQAHRRLHHLTAGARAAAAPGRRLPPRRAEPAVQLAHLRRQLRGRARHRQTGNDLGDGQRQDRGGTDSPFRPATRSSARRRSRRRCARARPSRGRRRTSGSARRRCRRSPPARSAGVMF